jgi:hypothetical protein
LGVAACLSAQTQTPNDANQIGSLVSGLCDHSRAVADVLDPNLSPSGRDKNLRRFRDTPYELTLQTEGQSVIAGDSASVPVRVHFKTAHSELETSATLQFVRRGNTWYFANFGFLGWPIFLIVVLVVGILIAIGYAGTALTLWQRLERQGQLSLANRAKLFIPLFWPSLFRQSHQTT